MSALHLVLAPLDLPFKSDETSGFFYVFRGSFGSAVDSRTRNYMRFERASLAFIFVPKFFQINSSCHIFQFITLNGKGIIVMVPILNSNTRAV